MASKGTEIEDSWAWAMGEGLTMGVASDGVEVSNGVKVTEL